MKITDYVVAAAQVGSMGKLSENIKAKRAEGYEPYGSPFVVVVNPTSTQVHQAMVKREATTEEVYHHMVSELARS